MAPRGLELAISLRVSVLNAITRRIGVGESSGVVQPAVVRFVTLVGSSVGNLRTAGARSKAVLRVQDNPFLGCVLTPGF